MRLWVGVTDPDWFSFLSRADIDEVNFWQPSTRAPFVGLEPGAPFLFKLKRPYNHIAGGGTFVKFSTLPLSLAWEVFERKNGAASREAFEAMIRPLTPIRRQGTPRSDAPCLPLPSSGRGRAGSPTPLVGPGTSFEVVTTTPRRYKARTCVLGSRKVGRSPHRRLAGRGPGISGTLR
jgi:putative restriction endonuclease